MKRIYQLLLLLVLLMAAYATRAQENSIVEITPPPKAQQQASDSTAQTASVAKPITTPNIPEGWVKTGEYSILNNETGVWETFPEYGPPPKSVTDLYMEGDYIWMSLITICLIGMLFAAWKAPRWIKEIGLLALVIGMVYGLMGWYAISDLISTNGYEIGKDLSSVVLFSGIRVGLIAPIYGLMVYGVSLILRIVVTPRI